MKNTHYMFSLRLYFHLHNEKLNSSFMKEMEKQNISEDIRIGLNGKLVCGRTETYTRKTDQDSRSPQGPAKGDSSTVDCYQFSVSMFPINERNKDKISHLYSVEKRDSTVIAKISHYTSLELRDLKSLCPPDLLKYTSILMPWLTDNEINCRVAQIAAETQDCIALTTDTFILWHRDWLASKTVSDSHLKIVENDAQKILFPRIIGGQTPERGCHFILWVFDKTAKKIRIYDNTQHNINISATDMDILKDVFRNLDSLEGWTVCNPQQ
ncbi:uncharacterized protein LOC143749670 [Siphateles boraxobius]|uniref:uncharacterized protein LOC143749670 n=1 Tax=Siphateles boraxobius TaxID=180520 RepID=UPI004063B88D